MWWFGRLVVWWSHDCKMCLFEMTYTCMWILCTDCKAERHFMKKICIEPCFEVKWLVIRYMVTGYIIIKYITHNLLKWNTNTIYQACLFISMSEKKPSQSYSKPSNECLFLFYRIVLSSPIAPTEACRTTCNFWKIPTPTFLAIVRYPPLRCGDQPLFIDRHYCF